MTKTKQLKEIPFNINNCIKVKLKKDGYKRLANLHNSYLNTIPKWKARSMEYYTSKADKDGYSSMQMWRFMEIFGPVTQIGFDQYYDTEILIKV